MSRWLGNRTGIGDNDEEIPDAEPSSVLRAAATSLAAATPTGQRRTSVQPASAPSARRTAPPPDLELFEFAPAGYLLIDADGKIELINRTGAAMLGWDARRLTSQPFLRWIVAADRPLLGALQNQLRTSAGPVTRVLRAKSREGRIVHLRLECARIPPRAPQPGGWCAIMIDVSDEQRSAHKLRRLQSQLEQLARLNTAGEMASNLAHELNQPLGTIMLNCDAALRLLESTCAADDEVREVVGQAREAAAFASNIIRRLRGFLCNADDLRDDCDLGTLIHDVSKLLETEMHDSDIDLQVEIAPDLPPVTADAVQIEQVLLNLARNAVEAIGEPAANPDRRLTIRAGREAQDRVRVSVEDTGPGLTARQLQRLFTPFYTTKPDGMGLGLSISRSIVEAHGGKLWAEADSRKGAVFSMSLPTADGVTHDG
jgi:two-component system sensor kinase FixL